MYSRLRMLPALVALPVSLFAQDSIARADSTPFRRGQWAAQFQAGSSFGSLGFIKFRSPTRALVLDARISGAHAEALATDTAGSRFIGVNSGASVQLRFGWRQYRPSETRVASHYTIGALAGFDHQASANPAGSDEQNGWTLGVFGDVGGTYLVTPRFGLGAIGSVALTYSTAISTQRPTNTRYRTWRLGGSAVSAALVATLFF